jgi:hypothetical protein
MGCSMVPPFSKSAVMPVARKVSLQMSPRTPLALAGNSTVCRAPLRCLRRPVSRCDGRWCGIGFFSLRRSPPLRYRRRDRFQQCDGRGLRAGCRLSRGSGTKPAAPRHKRTARFRQPCHPGSMLVDQDNVKRLAKRYCTRGHPQRELGCVSVGALHRILSPARLPVAWHWEHVGVTLEDLRFEEKPS